MSASKFSFTIAQPIRFTPGPVGPGPTRLACPFCHTNIVTATEKHPTRNAHICACILCVFGFWCCACIPYCLDSCLRIDHYCPNCGGFLGSFVSA